MRRTEWTSFQYEPSPVLFPRVSTTGKQRRMGMKVQTSRGIVYHDMQKQLGRRKGLEGRRIGGACWRGERDTHEGWVGGSQAQSLSSSILLREGKKGDMRQRKTMGNRQMSQSDILNSHTLMRPIYCRHQQWQQRGEASNKQPEKEEQKHTSKRTHTYTNIQRHTNTHIYWHTWPGGGCVIAVCLTQPCACCLDIYTSLSPQRTYTEPLCFYCLPVTIHTPTNYALIPSTSTRHLLLRYPNTHILLQLFTMNRRIWKKRKQYKFNTHGHTLQFGHSHSLLHSE